MPIFKFLYCSSRMEDRKRRKYCNFLNLNLNPFNQQIYRKVMFIRQFFIKEVYSAQNAEYFCTIFVFEAKFSNFLLSLIL